jgi:hypothetical protein
MTRRRRLAVFAWVLLLLAGTIGGALWWALRTNQLGRQIERGFSSRPLPGSLRIESTEVHGVSELVLSGVSLAPAPGAPAVATIPRIVISGELWKGHVDLVRIEGGHVAFDAASVRFFDDLIRAEVAHKGTGQPRLMHIAIVGADATVDGQPWLAGGEVAIDATGPVVAVNGTAMVGGEKLAVTVDTEGKGDDLRYRIALKPGDKQGRVPVREWSRRLAALKLLPAIPADAERWVPESADASGSVVVAQDNWERFTGDLRAVWSGGQGQAALRLDRHALKLDRLMIKDAAAGEIEGAVDVGLDDHAVEVAAVRWHPGPEIPLPPQIPVDDVLAVLPQAHLRAESVPDGWNMTVALSGTGKAVLSWAPAQPLVIDGANVPLSLLQKFLPEDVTLAAGRALKLHVVVHQRLEDFYAEVEQTRVLWRGWALGTVDGKVTAKPAPGGYDAEVTVPPMGSLHYLGDAKHGTLAVDLAAAEALMVRLKGPSSLPDLRGAIAFTADLERGGDTVTGRLRGVRLGALALPDLLKEFDATITGEFSLRPDQAQAHLVGQLTRGSVRIPGVWLDLARRRPIFNARLVVRPGTIIAQEVLVRATNEQGEALPDGYSAGLRGSFSTSAQAGVITGVVDHADLGWLTSTSLVQIPDGRIDGECAVTFSADLQREGIRAVDGYFLPLDVELVLGKGLRATGIKGAVKFRLARSDEAKAGDRPKP